MVEDGDDSFLAHGEGRAGSCHNPTRISTPREQTYRQENQRGPY
jgi:hypothetical protein